MNTWIRWIVLSAGVLVGLLVSVGSVSAQRLVVVGYAAPPPVVVYAPPAPVVTAAVPYYVTTTRYGLFGRRGYTTVDYGPAVVAPAPVVAAYYSPPVVRTYYAPPVVRAYYYAPPPPVIVSYP